MSKEKISFQDLVDQLALKAAVSKRAAEEFLKVMLATIEDALIAGEIVKIKGFGTFKPQWNEPRKSVNVNTGEEIVLEGYYKVSFTPDQSLKELVNEPFAHLEPVQLDEGEPITLPENDDEVALDPLRIFTEQATEIKDLLSEIQALSGGAKSVSEENTSVEAVSSESDDYLFVERNEEPIVFDTSLEDFTPVESPSIEQIEIHAPVQNEIPEEIVPEIVAVELVEEKPVDVVSHSTFVSSTEISSAFEPVKEEATEVSDVASVFQDEFASTPFLASAKQAKKRKKWWLIPVVVLVLALCLSALFIFYAPAGQWVNKKYADIYTSVSGWFTPKSEPKPIVLKKMPKVVVVPKDTNIVNDTTAETKDEVKNLPKVETVKSVEIPQQQQKAVRKSKIDTLQLLFDNPREYDEYIASEQIAPGSRLTIMSAKYYGAKDFWVYIYEANKERIPDPDHIQMGTLIRIPKLDPRLIDTSNPRCLKKARELHDKYVKRTD